MKIYKISEEDYKIAQSNMVLLHGTNSEFLPAIMAKGLKNPYLTNEMELANYYADVTSGNGVPIVLKVTIQDTSKLAPDRESLLEPVGYGSIHSSDIEDMISAMPQEDILDWRKTLPVTRTVQYVGIVPATDVEVEAT